MKEQVSSILRPSIIKMSQGGWISKWWGRERIENTAGLHGWPARKILNSRRSRMAITVTF